MRISVGSALVLLVLIFLHHTETVSSGSLEKTKGKPKTTTTTSPSILDRAASDDGNSIEPEQPMKECSSTNDCAPSYCCTVGMMRYSIPSCLPMGQLEDSCIPSNRPENFTLEYPNGEIRRPSSSYRLLCPCGFGLVCDPTSSSCIPPQKPPATQPSWRKEKKVGEKVKVPLKAHAEDGAEGDEE